MVVVPAPPVILCQRFPLHLAAALARNPLHCEALVSLACPTLLPVVGHNILSVGPAPEVALVLSKNHLNLINAHALTFTFLCSAAVNTLQPVSEIQSQTDVHNLYSILDGRDDTIMLVMGARSYLVPWTHRTTRPAWSNLLSPHQAKGLPAHFFSSKFM